MLGFARLLILMTLLCAACVGVDREIYTYKNPDQTTLDRLSTQSLAYADITTDKGESYLGPFLFVFSDGVCVSAAHPCIDAKQIEAIRVGQDKMVLINPGAALLMGAMAAAYADQSGVSNKERLDFSDSSSAWIKAASTPKGLRTDIRIKSTHYSSNRRIDPTFPCGWISFSASNPDIKTDKDAAQYLTSLRSVLPGSCLLATTDLIARYEPEAAVKFWMLGALRLRWERLQCQNAASYQDSFSHSPNYSEIDLKPATIDDFGRVSPAGFSMWSRLTPDDAKPLLGDSLQSLDEMFFQLATDENTFSHSPSLQKICEKSGGVAPQELRESRQKYLLEFSLSSDAEAKIFLGDEAVVGRDQILQRLSQNKGENL